MRIAVDALGGDRGLGEIVRGALQAAASLDVDVALVGPAERIGAELARAGATPRRVSIVDASETIGMDEPPLQAVRRKWRSSIVVGIELVKIAEAQAFVSAGNTGAVMAAATLFLGRLPGVERPALGAVLPARSGRRVLLLDVGANADCRPSQLVQFARIGQAYARRALGVEAPAVGLVSIGEEDVKGNQLVLETNALLRGADGINFAGNIEGRDLPSGNVTVAVTDGFTGNVILKTAEGTAEFILRELRDAVGAHTRFKLAALALRPAFSALRRRLDYAEYGGAPLLGVQGMVTIAHGRSDARAIANAIRAARDASRSGILAELEAAVRT